MRLFPYSVATGDLTEWDVLSDETCSYCATFHDVVDEMYADGHHGMGGAMDILGTETFAQEDGRFVVVVGYRQHPSQTVDADGSVVDDYPGTILYRPRVELVHDGSWRVTGVQMERAA